MDKNIILIGFMGCGKTSIGTKLARVLQWEFIDTDLEIENEYGSSISNIFIEQGEEAFREMETALLNRIKAVKHAVIATGGGMPLRPENATLLKNLGHVIFLKTTKETILERLKGDITRPLLSENAEEKIEKLMEERVSKYEAVADTVIVTDNRSFYEMIKEVEDKVIKKKKSRNESMK